MLTSLGDALLALRTDVERWATRHLSVAPSTRTAHHSQPRRHIVVDSWSRPLDATPTHLCIVVRDAHDAARTFSELFGVNCGPVTGPGVVFGPQDAVGEIMRCAVQLPNLFIEFIAPLNGDTSFHNFLTRHGHGIHHIGLRTRGVFDRIKDVLEERGGRQTATGLNNRYALFDFGEQFGSTIEVVVPELDVMGGVPSRTTSSRALGRHAISHIGIVVHDLERAAAHYANVVGAGVSAVRHVRPLFVPGVAASPGAGARLITIRHGGIAVLLMEPIGSSPWRDFLERRGNAVYALGLNVGAELRQTVLALRRRNLRQIVGNPEAGYVQFDLTREFGFMLGLSGTRVRRHARTTARWSRTAHQSNERRGQQATHNASPIARPAGVFLDAQ